MQRVQRFLVVAHCLADTANDSRLRVASEALLENARELRVTVIDEHVCGRLAHARETVDHFREGKKTSIDIRTLSETDSVCLRATYALAPCKVY